MWDHTLLILIHILYLRMMKRVSALIIISIIFLFLPGCKSITSETPKKQVEVEFEESIEKTEKEEEINYAEVDFDNEELHVWGVGFEAMNNTKAYQIFPVKNTFDFKIIRSTNILIAEILYQSKSEESLNFSVDLGKNEVIEKNVKVVKFDSSELTDDEILDIANSIKRRYLPFTDWK